MNMYFANVNGIKTPPSPGLKGSCYCCGNEVISKCGKSNIWHWSHIDLKQCDSWWENETEWHRKWKQKFPLENQEIIHYDKETHEKHVADVKTNNGVIIEFQNSNISIEELESRESFYGNMIWIVNGMNFKKTFFLYDKLPNPNSLKFIDYKFRQRTNLHSGAFYKKPFIINGNITYPIFSIRDIEKEIENDYIGHHLFHWSNPRNVWFQSKKKVFIDQGDDNLYELTNYKNDIPCIRKWNKAEFIDRALNPKK